VEIGGVWFGFSWPMIVSDGGLFVDTFLPTQ
jgi:hypothetical protein